MKNIEERFWSKADKSGECWEWTGSKMKTGYGRFGIRGINRVAHRFSYEISNGPIPDAMDIDHICHNRSCVRPDHLRAITHKQNTENRSGSNVKNTSGARGVHWRKDAKKWQALVGHHGKRYSAGYYDTVEEAADAARAKRLELHTHNDLDRAA